MSKFKVGDKVWCNGDVKIIKRVDEWENGEYGYYFNVDDELLNYQRECDLELYKSPHERLLDIGWKIDESDINSTIKLYYKNNDVLLINEITKTIRTIFNFNLELAEILVDYLKELEK